MLNSIRTEAWRYLGYGKRQPETEVMKTVDDFCRRSKKGRFIAFTRCSCLRTGRSGSKACRSEAMRWRGT